LVDVGTHAFLLFWPTPQDRLNDRARLEPNPAPARKTDKLVITYYQEYQEEVKASEQGGGLE